MKRNISILLMIVVSFSCQKELHFPLPKNIESNPYLHQVRDQLKRQLPSSLVNDVDYRMGVLTRLNNDSILLLRLPFRGIEIKSKFILIKTDKVGNIQKGKIITINKTNNKEKAYRFDGKITIQSLTGESEIQSNITNGYIEAFHPMGVQSRKNDVSIHIIPDKQPTYVTMPEIVIFGMPSGGNISYSDWYNLQMLISGNTDPFFYGWNPFPYTYYSSAEQTNGVSSGGYSSSYTYSNENSPNNPYGIYGDDPKLVDFEEHTRKTIDLESYLKCFDNIPDDGATCSIELFTDVPVDENPLAGFNVQTGSPGHTFLQLHKKNGAFDITQNIGFYPASQLKTLLTTAPIEGEFADNQHHEFNASIKMPLSAEMLRSLIRKMIDLKKEVKYDIDDYNCTDFSLEAFNFARKGNELEIQRFDIPGAVPTHGSNTPQGVFLKLRQIKDSNNSEAAAITIPGYKAWAGNSKGPC